MKDLREALYYLVRIPTALLGLGFVLVSVAPFFVPILDEPGQEMGLGWKIVFFLICLIPGVFVLLPNHKFSSARLFRFRLAAMAVLGTTLIWAGVSMILSYRAGGKDSAMVGIAVFFFYNSVALPLSVWLRRRTPEA